MTFVNLHIYTDRSFCLELCFDTGSCMAEADLIFPSLPPKSNITGMHYYTQAKQIQLGVECLRRCLHLIEGICPQGFLT